VPSGRVRSVSEAVRSAGGSPVTGIPPSVPGKCTLRPPRLDEHGDLVREHGWEAFARADLASDRPVVSVGS
jgi:hypothetical protein